MGMKISQKQLMVLMIALAVVATAATILSTGKQLGAFATGVPCAGASLQGAPGVTERIELATGERIPGTAFTVRPDCSGSFFEAALGTGLWNSIFQSLGFQVGQGLKLEATANVEKQKFENVNDRESVEYGAYGLPGSCGGDPSRTTTFWGIPGDYGALVTITPQCGAYPTRWIIAGSKIVGTKGHLAPTAEVQSSTTLCMTLDDGRRACQKVTSQQRDIQFKLENQTVMWCSLDGSLVTGAAFPDTTGVVTILKTGGSWNLATVAEWSAHQRVLLPSTTGPELGSWAASKTFSADQLFASQATLSVPGSFVDNGAGYAVESPSRLQTPLISCFLRGSVLGLVKTSGEPRVKVNSVTPDPYYAGRDGQVDLTLTNAGNFTSGFNTYLDCGAGLQTIAQPVTVNAKQSVPWSIDFNFNNEGTYSCSVIATDPVAQLTAKAPVTIVAKKPQVCQPGITQVVSNYVVNQCKADGSGVVNILDCSDVVTETIKANTCAAVSVVNVISEAEAAAGATPPPATGPQGGAEGVCRYGYVTTSILDGSEVLFDTEADAILASMGAEVKPAFGLVVPSDYVIRGNAPPQYDPQTGTFSCGDLSVDPRANIVSVTKVTPSQPAPAATQKPSVKAPLPVQAPPPGAPQPTPGFEAVFAVAGLVAVAYVVSRRKP